MESRLKEMSKRIAEKQEKNIRKKQQHKFSAFVNQKKCQEEWSFSLASMESGIDSIQFENVKVSKMHSSEIKTKNIWFYDLFNEQTSHHNRNLWLYWLN